MNRAPHICSCGKVVPAGIRCTCQRKRDAERKARFDRTRPSSRERGYDAEWEKARKAFLREFPWCPCGAPANTVDHIVPHRGNRDLFWNRANWQPLCTPCHSGRKQREERRQGRL